MRKCHTVLLCSFVILFAAYLRGARGDFLRESITFLLGYQWRAVLEHLAMGFAVPLLCGMCLSVDCRVGNRALAAVPLQPNRRVLAWMNNSGVPGVVLVFSLACFICQFVFEWEQAHRSVYGGTARGHLQWEQIAADGLGCWFAYRYSLSRFGRDVISG